MLPGLFAGVILSVLTHLTFSVKEDEKEMSRDMFRGHVITAFAILVLLVPIGFAEGQSPAHFSLTMTGQTLTAGFNNNVTITATNSYYGKRAYSSGSIYDVDLAVSITSPLQMFGDNHWYYDLIRSEQSVAVSFQVYAPTAAIGNSYEGSVTLTYRELGEISYTQETHTIGFSVHGWINLVLYGIQITPAVASPGGNATVSGNLLNSGNIAAYNANVTVESEALAPGTTASLYLGEVDPNIARPFSLMVHFGKNLSEGTYAVVVKVSAIDSERPSSPYDVQQLSQIELKKPTVQPPIQRPQAGGAVGMILEILRYLFGLFFGSSTLPMPFEWSTVFSENTGVSGLGS